VVETYSTSEAVIGHALEVAFAPGGQKDETTPYPFKFEKWRPGLLPRATVYHYNPVNLPVSQSCQKCLRWLPIGLYHEIEPTDDKSSDANSDYVG